MNVIGWAVFDPKGNMLWKTLAPRRDWSIKLVQDKKGYFWNRMKEQGFTVREVQIKSLTEGATV